MTRPIAAATAIAGVLLLADCSRDQPARPDPVDTSSVAALDPDDGSVDWRNGPGRISYGTPMVIHVDGQDQLVYQSEDEIIGLDPGNGTRLWSHPSVNVNRDNISPPIWGVDGLLWTSMQLEGGTRLRARQSVAGR